MRTLIVYQQTEIWGTFQVEKLAHQKCENGKTEQYVRIGPSNDHSYAEMLT